MSDFLGDRISSCELIDWMGDDNAVVDAARVSFHKRSDQFSQEQNDKLLRYLLDHDHTSPLEMVDFKFRIKAPVMVWWHVVRHRMASYNLQSGRYTEYNEDEFYVPRVWRAQSKSNKQGSAGEVSTDCLREYLVQKTFYDALATYRVLLDQGIAKEQARIVLPGFACYHEGIVKMNLRSLANFLTLRRGEDAQWETRQLALAMEQCVRETHPKLMEMLFDAPTEPDTSGPATGNTEELRRA